MCSVERNSARAAFPLEEKVEFLLILTNAGSHNMHWTLGILRHFQAFFSLRVFPVPKQNPRPPANH
jgi:hypothetical protein